MGKRRREEYWFFEITSDGEIYENKPRWNILDHCYDTGAYDFDKPTIFHIAIKWVKNGGNDWQNYDFVGRAESDAFYSRLAYKLKQTPDPDDLWGLADSVAASISNRYRTKFNRRARYVPKNELVQQSSAVTSTQASTRVYLFDMSNDTIKFGISDDVVGRRAAIRTGSGLEVVRWCYTPNFAYNIAKQIESTLLTATDKFKTLGEFRRMDYDDAKALLLSQSSIEREHILEQRNLRSGQNELR